MGLTSSSMETRVSYVHHGTLSHDGYWLAVTMTVWRSLNIGASYKLLLRRLMHFGSPLVASPCLLELFTRISDQRNRTREELKCTMEYLMSIVAVLEGLILYSSS
ncbi:unnamed protein product [Prunus brigantina]